MNKRDKFAIVRYALGQLTLWKRIIDEAERVEPEESRRCWYKLEARQAYQDSLQGLKRISIELIEDYDVAKVRVKVQGVWYGVDDIPERYKIRFARERKARPVIVNREK